MRARLDAVLAVLVPFTTAVVDLPGQHTRARWRLDEGSGQVAHDQARHHLDGGLGTTSATDAADPAWIAGRFGNALRFNGGQRVQVASTAALEPQQLSIEAWVRRLGSPGAFRYVVSKSGLGGAFASYAIYTGSGGLTFYVTVGTSTFVLAPPVSEAVIWNGAWHHVIGTYDGVHVRLYFDGAQVGSGATAPTPTINYNLQSTTFLIGDYGGAPGFSFAGDIDEVRFWGRALNASEVALRAQGLEVDNTAPVVTITEPAVASPVHVASASASLRAAIVEDAESLVSSMPGLLDQLLPQGGGTVGPVLFPLDEGANTIAVTATDEDGNVGGDTVIIVRDTIAPTIVLVSPLQSVVGDATVELQVEVEDANGAAVTFGNSPPQTIAPPGRRLSYITTLTTGVLNSIPVRAVDPAGNVAALTVELRVDLATPTVRIDSPEPDASFGPGQELVELVATVQDDSDAEVSSIPAGILLSVVAPGGQVRGFVRLHEGRNALVVTAVDPLYHTGSDQRNVLLDTTPPELTLVEPGNNSSVRGSIEVVGSATDRAGNDPGAGVERIDFYVDGQFAAADAGAIELDTRTLTDGWHQLGAIAVDLKGNRSLVVQVSVFVDNTPPNVVLRSPWPGTYVAGLVPFAADVADAGSGVAQATMLVAGLAPTGDASAVYQPPVVAAVLTGSENTASRWPDGPIEFVVRAVDAAGNVGVARATVILDNTLPASLLVTPTEGQVVAGVFPIRVEADDTHFASIEVLVDGILLGSSPTTPYGLDFDSRAHLDGPLTVTARTMDIAGNVATNSVRVTVNNQTSFDLSPDVLNLRSRGKSNSITARLEGSTVPLLAPPASHTYELIITGGPPVSATANTVVLADADQDLVPDLAVKFDRQALIAAIQVALANGAIRRDAPIDVSLRATPTGGGSGRILATAKMRIE